MGLVRRDQIVALLECGVFEDATQHSTRNSHDDFDDELDDASYTSNTPSNSTTSLPEEWTPRPGIGKSPLMNLAFHIKDDRYTHLEHDSSRPSRVLYEAPLRDREEDPPHVRVGVNSAGNVCVRWVPPSMHRKWIHLASVMNVGTYTVTEFCPVSKAHFLFTALGLRHLIVLGGSSGGIVTRINLLPEFIQERIESNM
jgi:hypothetical protein